MESESEPSRQYDVSTRVFSNLSEAEVESCLRIIKEGSAVNPRSAEAELSLAQVLAVALSGVDIVGIGAIKRYRPGYAAEIARRSKSQFEKESAEVGYIAVANQHRGNKLSHRLVSKLLNNHTGPLFATTDNEFMKMTLQQAGFKRQGEEWQGKRGVLSLWIRC